VLVSIDDMPATSIDDVHRVLSFERIDTPVQVGILRRERKLDVTLRPVELV